MKTKVTEDGRIIWEGIPEAYWPHPNKPWRVAWGFGCHEDFATEDEARLAYLDLKADQPGDWADLVREPFNAIEMDRS